MNFCVITRSVKEHFQSGGMETQLDNLLKGLMIKGHKITVITTSHPQKNITEKVNIIEGGINYIFVANTTPGYNPLSSWEKLLLYLGFLRKRVEKEGTKDFYKEAQIEYDKLCVTDKKRFHFVLSQSTAARDINNKHGAKIITILHGTIRGEIENRFKSNITFLNWIRFFIIDIPKWTFEFFFVSKKLYDLTESIVVVSQNLKSLFLKDYPQYKEKIKVIYNGVDENRFVEKKFINYNESFDVLYVGRMDREKGVDIILESALHMKETHIPIRFVFVGEGIHLNEFKEYANKNALNNVQFVGSVSNEKTAEFYQKSKIFIFPSRRKEGHPMTISESLCSGLPVITTRSGGLGELYSHGVEGFYIDNEDPISLSNYIEYLYKNPDMLIKMSKLARKLALSKYTRSAMIRKYVELFDSLYTKI